MNRRKEETPSSFLSLPGKSAFSRFLLRWKKPADSQPVTALEEYRRTNKKNSNSARLSRWSYLFLGLFLGISILSGFQYIWSHYTIVPITEYDNNGSSSTVDKTPD